LDVRTHRFLFDGNEVRLSTEPSQFNCLILDSNRARLLIMKFQFLNFVDHPSDERALPV